MALKKGDKVEVICNKENSDYYSVGDTGIVYHVDSSGEAWIKFIIHNPKRDKLLNQTWCVSARKLKLIEDKGMGCRIKKGDKVKVLRVSGNSPWGGHNLKIGKEYTVESVGENSSYYDETGYYFSGQTLQASEIELVTEWKEMRCIDAAAYPNKLTVGKVYQVKDATGYDGHRMYNIKMFDNCSTSGRVFRKRFEEVVDACDAPAYTANAVCIDPGSYDQLVCGAEYYIDSKTPHATFTTVYDVQTGERLCQPYSKRFKRLSCTAPAPAPAPACETEHARGTYIVWSPTSSKAPTRTYPTHKQARRVARSMAEQHKSEFFVMEALNKYSAVTTVTKETL